jgi:arsenate reductase
MNERDLAKKPFTKDEIIKLSENYDIKSFINPKSTPYKSLGLDLTKLSKEEMIDLLSKEVNLFKRPFIIKEELVLFGFSESDYQKLLG